MNVRSMMTSSNENLFRVTGHLRGEFTEFPAQRPVTRSFEVFLNERLSKQSRGWWFETPSCPLWRNCKDLRILLPLPLPCCLSGQETVILLSTWDKLRGCGHCLSQWPSSISPFGVTRSILPLVASYFSCYNVTFEIVSIRDAFY